MFTHKAPLQLWREARALLSKLWNIFESPSAIASEGMLSKHNHDLLCTWLRACEAMLRALLFVEAVELCVAGDLPPLKQRASRPRQPRDKRVHEPNHPETWRVRFRVLDPVGKPRRGKRALTQQQLGPRIYNAWPLAERAESLRRVFNEPASFIRRLARKLRANRDDRLRINRSADEHLTVMQPFVWDEVCMAFLEADRRLCNSS